MKKNEITTKEKLKNYFKTGKYPTESQFAELIDYLKLKDDVLTNKEIVTISNSLASLDNPYVAYYCNNVEDNEFSIVVTSKDEEDQLLTMKNTSSQQEKRYFHGNAPYSIMAKEFPAEGLGEYQYYYLFGQIDDNNYHSINRLFGNNLPTIPDGFELGTVENKKFFMQISKSSFGRKINNLYTNFEFINRTGIAVQYAISGAYWSSNYTSGNMITDHYDMWDYLYCSYKANLTETNKTIECKLYDADSDTLLMTAILSPGEIYQNASAGGRMTGIRNVRIECDYEQ